MKFLLPEKWSLEPQGKRHEENNAGKAAPQQTATNQFWEKKPEGLGFVSTKHVSIFLYKHISMFHWRKIRNVSLNSAESGVQFSSKFNATPPESSKSFAEKCWKLEQLI